MKLIKFYLISTLMMLAALIVYMLYLAYGPTHIPEVFNEPYPVGGEFMPGGQVSYSIQYCAPIHFISSTVRWLVSETDGSQTLFNAPNGANVLPNSKDCTNKKPAVANILVILPKTLAPGKYHIRVVTTYEVNSFRNVPKEHITQSFIIK